MIGEFLLNSGYVGIAILIFLTVNSIFYRLDGFSSREARNDMSLWLLSLNPKEITSQWQTYFITLFDEIFRSKKKRNLISSKYWSGYISSHTFSRSVLATFISIILIALIGHSLKLEVFHYDTFSMIIKMALSVTLLNMIPDYLSLLETRYMLELLKSTTSKIKIIIFLIIDFIISTMILLLSFSFFLIAAYLYLGEIPIVIDGSNIVYKGYGNYIASGNDSILELLSRLFQYFSRSYDEIFKLGHNFDAENIVGVSIYSSLFTSVWIWLFGISNLVIGLAKKTELTLNFLKYALPIRSKPFRAVGIIASIVASVTYLLVAYIGAYN